ncbi:hypothetical protein D3C72_1889510 [compost metagenome]
MDADRGPAPGVVGLHPVGHVAQAVTGVIQGAGVEEARRVQQRRGQLIDLGLAARSGGGGDQFQLGDGSGDRDHDVVAVAVQTLVGAALDVGDGASARLGHLAGQGGLDLQGASFGHSATLWGLSNISMSD